MDFINIQTRQEFDEMLADLNSAFIVVADTETNGLRYYRENYVISISLYFPEHNRAYNIPYRHGDGTVEVKWKNSPVPFDEMTWQGKTKTQLFLRYWWSKFHADNVGSGYFGNIPETWIDELKALWGREGVSYVFHNARFDLHMLGAEGFPTPDIVEDTMIALHLVHEDWRGIEVEAPYKNNGLWAMDENGNPFTKKQRGNRQLKWQAGLLRLPNFHVGESELNDARQAMEGVLADYIMAHVEGYANGTIDALDAYLDGLVYADIRKRKDGCLDKWGEKQYDRIFKKVALDSKANMWMLPSDKVATYAMLDTVLTWFLREELMPILEKWDNVELYHNTCEIQLKVAWVMENNGLQLDMNEARKQIKVYEPRITDLEQRFNDLAQALSEAYGTETVTCPVCEGTNTASEDIPFDVEPDDLTYCEHCDNKGTVEQNIVEPTVNVNSNKQLPAFLKAAVQISFPNLNEFIPDWVDGQTKASLVNEPIQVKQGQLEKANKEALRPFEDHPVVWLLFEYRKLKKTVNTYMYNWIDSRDANDIVRGSLDVTGTVAGRMSSYGEMGNLQNIPERNGYTIKKAIIARPNNILWAVDYGQLEARLAAWIAEVILPAQGAYHAEPIMTNLFESGEDMHAYVRDMINVREVMFSGMSTEDILIAYGEPVENKTPEQREAYVARKVCRQIAKTLNFGLLYRGTYCMIMNLLRIGETQAKHLEYEWRKLFPAFASAQQYYETLAQTWRVTPDGKGRGMFATQPITGRHRKMHMYSTSQTYYDSESDSWLTFNPQEANARKVWNNIVQGLGGWMSTNAMMNFANEVGYGGMKPYAQIHDALDGMCDVNELWRVQKLMEYMVDYDTRPTLTVDLEACPPNGNWQPYSKDNPLGMREVHDVPLWIESKGELGYE